MTKQQFIIFHQVTQTSQLEIRICNKFFVGGIISYIFLQIFFLAGKACEDLF
jgi:hypothetical protein